MCYALTIPKISPYNELQDYQGKPFGSHSLSLPQKSMGREKKLVTRHLYICGW